jgi:hypothetical protein
MGQSTSWQDNSSFVSKEIPCILRKKVVYSGIQNKPPLIAIRSQMNPAHEILSCLFKVQFNIILPFTSRSSKLSVSFRFPN